MRRVYEHAAGWEINFESSEKDIKRPKRKQLSREDRLDKVASPDELNAIFRSARFRRNNLYLYLRFLLFTGMRPSEAATLYWERLPAKQEKEEIKNNRSIDLVSGNSKEIS